MFLRNILLSQGSTVVTPVTTYAASTSVLSGSQSFNCGSDSSLALGDGDKTSAIWFKTTSGAYSRIFSQGDQNVTDYYDVYMLGNGQIWARADQHSPSSNQEWRTNATGFNDGDWHLLVVRWNSYGTYDIYIDNVSQAVTNSNVGSPTSLSAGADLYIGEQSGGGSGGFVGELGFGGFWDGTLTTGEMTTLYNGGDALCHGSLGSLTTNLVSYWHFADFTGHTTDELTDQEGSNNATNNGSITFTGSGLDVSC